VNTVQVYSVCAGVFGSAEYLRPVSDRRYESHITPGGAGIGSYMDEGPYERRLPTVGAAAAAGGLKGPQQQPQPKSLNGNFILRPSDDYRYYR